MKYLTTVLFASISFSSCATAPSAPTRAAIDFALVESLSKSDMTTSDLRKALGSPHEISRKFSGQEIWFYYGDKENLRNQKLALNVDVTSQKLVSSTWLPDAGELLSDRTEVEKHFLGRRFSAVPNRIVKRHYATSDVTYRDTTGQISYFYDHGMVWAISVDSPKLGHQPASNLE